MTEETQDDVQETVDAPGRPTTWTVIAYSALMVAFPMLLLTLTWRMLSVVEGARTAEVRWAAVAYTMALVVVMLTWSWYMWQKARSIVRELRAGQSAYTLAKWQEERAVYQIAWWQHRRTMWEEIKQRLLAANEAERMLRELFKVEDTPTPPKATLDKDVIRS